MSNFKIGDKVILIHADGVFTLIKNRTYTISGFGKYDSYHVSVLEDSSNCLYNTKRFVLDIKKVRKDKLKEIYNNQI